MPNLNGRGPRNEGPRTGRGLGNCAPNTNTAPREAGRRNNFNTNIEENKNNNN